MAPLDSSPPLPLFLTIFSFIQHDDGGPGQEPDPDKCVAMHAAAHAMLQEVALRMTQAGLWQEAAQSVRVSNGLGALSSLPASTSSLLAHGSSLFGANSRFHTEMAGLGPSAQVITA